MLHHWFRRVVLAQLPLFTLLTCHAQDGVLIGSGQVNHPKAILELRSTTQGLLMPRLTGPQISGITSPATGLLLYRTGTNAYRYYNGTSWVALSSGDNLGDHNATQNVKLGTYQLVGEGGTNGIYLNNVPNAAIGATTFDGTNPERLKIEAGTTTSVNLISAMGELNDQLQVNLKNSSNQNGASTDFVVTNNTGTETSSYLNMGINSSGYNQAAYNIGSTHDSYLYCIGTGAAGTGGNLSIGTATANSVIKFHTGGTTTAQERMRIGTAAGSPFTRIGTSTTDANSSLQVLGSLSVPVYVISWFEDTYTATDDDHTILAECTWEDWFGAYEIDVILPSPVGIPGREYAIKKLSETGTNVRIDTSNGSMIDNINTSTTTYNLTTRYQSVVVQSDGTRWLVVGKNL